ncbi:hypothetical protein [Chelatococcus sp.]|nr:hypothetical protein [Chelatococcus sp.]
MAWDEMLLALTDVQEIERDEGAGAQVELLKAIVGATRGRS